MKEHMQRDLAHSKRSITGGWICDHEGVSAPRVTLPFGSLKLLTVPTSTTEALPVCLLLLLSPSDPRYV